MKSLIEYMDWFPLKIRVFCKNTKQTTLYRVTFIVILKSCCMITFLTDGAVWTNVHIIILLWFLYTNEISNKRVTDIAGLFGYCLGKNPILLKTSLLPIKGQFIASEVLCHLQLHVHTYNICLKMAIMDKIAF